MEKDTDYIPVSARVDFKLQVMKEDEELPEYIEVNTEVSNIIKEKQVALKASIIEAIELERLVIK
jgi:hypothetical protein